MNSGRYILSQLLNVIHRQTLDRAVKQHGAESGIHHFGFRQQLVCMFFAQLTHRESLRDIATCLNAKPSALYHLGFRKPVAKSTLADANEHRDWRIWEQVAAGLIKRARPLYEDEDLGIDLDNAIYALDSTTIDLSLSLFPWADFRSSKSGIKVHTQIELRGPIPVCIHIANARPHDVLWLDKILFEAGAFYLMDRAYVDFARLYMIHLSGAFFVVRAKRNFKFTRQYSLPVDRLSGVRSDHVGKPKSKKAKGDFPSLLRKIRYYDADSQREFIFLTNNLQIPAATAAQLYKMRWRIELFFRWIKSHLRIKRYFGTSPNAVKTQIWISMIVYLVIAILHKQLRLPGSLNRTLQILSVHPFEKIPINTLLSEEDSRTLGVDDCNQLKLWDL